MSKSEHFLMKNEFVRERRNPVNVTGKGKLKGGQALSVK
jgi:hypothetical protein